MFDAVGFDLHAVGSGGFEYGGDGVGGGGGEFCGTGALGVGKLGVGIGCGVDGFE